MRERFGRKGWGKRRQRPKLELSRKKFSWLLESAETKLVLEPEIFFISVFRPPLAAIELVPALP